MRAYVIRDCMGSVTRGWILRKNDRASIMRDHLALPAQCRDLLEEVTIETALAGARQSNSKQPFNKKESS
jgi:hypothetical protein